MSDTQGKFKHILRELGNRADISTDTQALNKFKTELEEILIEVKNHNYFYADILAALIALKKNRPDGEMGLRHNLDCIIHTYKDNAPKDMLKLHAYVNLETTRLEYTEANFAKAEVQKDVAEAKATIQKMQSASENIKKEVRRTKEETKEKIAGLQKEHITILSIFSGIVLSFTGGAIFTSSVLQNLGNVSIGKLILVLTLVGFVLVNGIYGLLYYVYLLTNNHRNNIDKTQTNKAMKPIWFINGLLIIILVLNWYFNKGNF